MELRTWAEGVLHGDTLADKLRDPGRLTDAAPGQRQAIPTSPARPPELPIAAPGERPPPDPLPGPDALADPAARARLLRRFAHHELQALELMAAVLLRFPDAETGFRRTLASTLRDEQRHLALYLDRMAILGLPAPAPGSRFFWDILADAPDPAAFVAGMSLTLEQANLDFLTGWRRALASSDDTETIAILDEVHRDEIRHVRHGVTWLGRWCDHDEDLWQAWTRHLQAPLTPRRARGPVFDREARRRAGLPEHVIDRVRAAGASKGRRPRLYTFTPWVEATWAQPGFTPSKTLRALAGDLAPTLAALCGEDDALLLPRAQDPAFLADLAERGWPLPRRVIGEDLAEVQGSFEAVIPWGSRPSDTAEAAHLELRRAPRHHRDTVRLAGKDGVPEALAALAGRLDDDRLDLEAGRVCRSVAEVEAALAHWPEPVVKLPLATAGRGVLREPGSLERLIGRQGAVIVEPWRERVLDLSLQATVTDDGLRNVQLGRFLADRRGRFRGAIVGGWRQGLSTEVQRFLSGDGHDPDWVRRSLTAALRTALERAPGHRGPVGIDAFIARVNGRLRLRPLVEVNPRLTFGRVAGAVGRRLLARGRAGVWLHLTRRDLGPFTDFRELAAALPAPRGTPLRHGALATTDPAQAEVVWTVLLAAPSPAEALALLPAAVRERLELGPL